MATVTWTLSWPETMRTRIESPSLTATVVAPIPTFYWSGQAVDGSWTGSAFAPEQSVGLQVANAEAIPTEFALRGSPNPVRNSCAVTYDVPGASRVQLEVFDVSGRRMLTLVSGVQEAGRHQITWDGKDEHGRRAAAGIYYYRL